MSRSAGRRPRRRGWNLVLFGVAGLLSVYYVVVLFAGDGDRRSSTAPLDDATPADGNDGITVELEVVAVDSGTRSLDLTLRPVPRGSYQSERDGRLRRPVHVQMRTPDAPPVGYDFPARQSLDPVAATVDTTGDAHTFPFDRQQMALHVEASSDDGAVPVDIVLADKVDGWQLSATADERGRDVQLEVESRRETLAVSFALFYIAGTAVVAMIAVTIIGGAVNRRQVDFERVIWLGAMLVVIPAVRNEMPGVPPVGTAVDLFVFFPAVVIVAAALLAAIVVLTVDEARARTPADPD